MIIVIFREGWHHIIDFEICTSAPASHWLKADTNVVFFFFFFFHVALAVG